MAKDAELNFPAETVVDGELGVACVAGFDGDHFAGVDDGECVGAKGHGEVCDIGAVVGA